MIDKTKMADAMGKFLISYKSIFLDKEDANEIVRGMQNGFEAGVNWALQSLWHDVSEKPKEWGKTILYQRKDGSFNHINIKKSAKNFVDMDCYALWYHHSGFYKPVKWLYIDDLLSKEGGE